MVEENASVPKTLQQWQAEIANATTPEEYLSLMKVLVAQIHKEAYATGSGGSSDLHNTAREFAGPFYATFFDQKTQETLSNGGDVSFLANTFDNQSEPHPAEGEVASSMAANSIVGNVNKYEPKVIRAAIVRGDPHLIPNAKNGPRQSALRIQTTFHGFKPPAKS